MAANGLSWRSVGPRVFVAGGGVAGLEAALAVHELTGGSVQLKLLAPDPDFVYRPLIVRETFSSEPADRVALEPALAPLGIEVIPRGLAAVDPAARSVALDDAETIDFDYAVIATGAKLKAPYRRAHTLWVSLWADRLDGYLGRPGEEPERLSFIVPPGTSWPLPLYEVALMAAREIRERGSTTAVRIVSPERAPLAIFGEQASTRVAEFLRGHEIEFFGSTRVEERENGTLTTIGATDPTLDGALIALPLIVGPRVGGLPADADGFIPIDEHARIRGLDRIYAAGDASDFPIKQGGLATQQADAAAEHIAMCVGAITEAEPFRPVLRGKILTGGESLNMRAEISGGRGEGQASSDYLWWPPHKICGRYLAPWLARESYDPEPPPARPVDVEVSLPVEWHPEPMLSSKLGS